MASNQQLEHSASVEKQHMPTYENQVVHSMVDELRYAAPKHRPLKEQVDSLDCGSIGSLYGDDCGARVATQPAPHTVALLRQDLSDLNQSIKNGGVLAPVKDALRLVGDTKSFIGEIPSRLFHKEH